MTLEVVPFSSASSEIDGLKIIHVKMVTDERGTVRELFRQSQHSQVLVNPNMAWKQVNLTRTKRGAVCGYKTGQSYFGFRCHGSFNARCAGFCSSRRLQWVSGGCR